MIRSHARWRAASLLLVHLVVALHVGHWLATKRTLSPVEPSESMYALELGLVNAGAIFFALTLLSTLVVGRFFCGWGCHVIALQDLCAWLMRKAGVRPRAFRSRLLAFAPMVLALYMFVWPTILRVVFHEGPPFPGFRAHLWTDDFWRTFPGPAFAVLTFLACGFLAVWTLGSKGFCTYGCPYGAFFGVMDRLAPVRIVAHGCRQAGECTPACTSNVLVHLEVRRHAMVVDSGCMKCMDCVDACPNDALSVGLGKPAILVGPPAARTVEGSRLPWGEEILAALVMLGSTLAFRGLYDGPPLLMAIGLGAITAFLAVQLLHLSRRATVRLQSWTLKAGGDWTTRGRLVAIASVAWLAFTAHSGFVQWHRERGATWLGRTQVPREAVLAGEIPPKGALPQHDDAVRRARRHLDLASRWGLVPVTDVDLGLAWLDLLARDDESAERRIRAVVARRPNDASRHENLVELLLARGRLADAVAALRAKIAEAGDAAEDEFRLGVALVEEGRMEESVAPLQRAAELSPSNGAVRYNLGAVLRRLGRDDEARAQLEEAARLLPDDPQVREELDAIGR